MADTKLTDLATGTTLHSADWLVYVDTTDTTMAATGTDKKLSPAVLAAALTIAESQVTGLTGDLAAKATDMLVVHLAGTETISGAKTFSTLPVLGTLTGIIKAATGVLSAAVAGTDYLTPSGSGASLTGITESQVAGLVTDLAGKAADTLVVHLAGTETITGAKSFSSVPTWPTQTANRFFAGPGTGVAAAPTFRLLVGADLPNPSATTLGGIQSAAAIAHQWIASISTSGVPSLSQPAFSDISGTVAAAQLPSPTATTLGGIESLAAVTSKWINAISTSGVPSATQPAFTDISGSAAVAQLPVMVASGASHAAGIAPDPGVTAGTTHFLREDATWAVPAGGGGSPGGSSGQIQYNNAAAFAGASLLTVGASGNLNLGSQAAPTTPTNGDMWLDSTQLCQTRYDNGLVNYRLGLVFSQVTNVSFAALGSASLVSTTAAIGSVSLPAGYLNVAGRILRLRAKGYCSSAAASAGSRTLFLKLGASVIATTDAVGFSTSTTNRSWSLECDVCCKATGVSGKLDCFGIYIENAPSGGSANALSLQNGTTAGTRAPATQVTLDLTAAYVFDLQLTYGAWVTGDTYTCTNLTLEVLG